MGFQITQLIERDFMGIESAHIDVDKQRIVILRGPNGAGKSSALSGIVAALEGKKSDPEVPIRDGARNATVRIQLADRKLAENYTVEVNWSSSNRSLTVRDKSGARVSSPATFIDQMKATHSFNPITLLTMAPAKRMETLMNAIGRAEDYTAMMLRREQVYKDRTACGQERDRLAAILKSNPDPCPDKELEEVDVKALKDISQRYIDAAGNLTTIRSRYTVLKNGIETTLSMIDATRSQIKALEAQVAADLKKLEGMRALEAEIKAEFETAKIKAEEAAAANEEANKVAESSRQTNELCRKQKEHRKTAADWDRASRLYQSKTSEIKDIDGSVIEMLAESEIGKKVPGVSIEMETGSILYNNMPIEQVNQAIRIRIACMIFSMLSPKISVMCFDEGDALDPDSMKALETIAEEMGFQIWMTANYAGDDTRELQLIVPVGGGVAGEKRKAESPPAAAAGATPPPVAAKKGVVTKTKIDDLEL